MLEHWLPALSAVSRDELRESGRAALDPAFDFKSKLFAAASSPKASRSWNSIAVNAIDLKRSSTTDRRDRRVVR
jgi:hypothetical protein